MESGSVFTFTFSLANPRGLAKISNASWTESLSVLLLLVVAVTRTSVNIIRHRIMRCLFFCPLDALLTRVLHSNYLAHEVARSAGRASFERLFFKKYPQVRGYFFLPYIGEGRGSGLQGSDAVSRPFGPELSPGSDKQVFRW